MLACILFCFVFVFLLVINVPNLRTCACFPVTSVPRVASTAVWANSIGALCVHVTSGRQSGAFINIWSENESFNQSKHEMFNDLTWFRKEKKNRLVFSIPAADNNSLPNLRTYASSPVISVPGIANTTVWTKSVVALRAYVTHWKRSSAFVNIWKRKSKTKSKENCKEVVYTLLRK